MGKDTVIDAWRKVNDKITRVVAYTTRKPRSGEVQGIDYNFVTVPLFKQLVKEGAFLEHKEVHGNFYATPIREMEAMLERGQIAILKIDVQGAMIAMKRRPEALSVFILPPSWDELEQRIRGRGTDDDQAIEMRLRNARVEMDMADKYRHCVINREVEDTVKRLQDLVA